MDTSKINPFVFLLFPFLFFSNLSFASIVDLAGSGATWLRDTNSENLMKLTPNSSAVLSGNNLTLVEKVNIPTSKGLFAVDLQRTAAVDISRIGKAVGVAARALGPIGLGLTAADLICSLSTICNQDGQWMVAPEATSYEPNSYPASNGQWLAWGSRFVATPEAGCRDAERIQVNVGVGFTYDHMEEVTPDNYKCYARRISDGSVFYASNTSRIAGCAPGYTLQGSNCVKDGVVSSPATAQDWDNKAGLLNDIQFTNTLLDKQYPVPVQAPSITIPQKFPIGNQTTTLKDGNGNTTGTQTTTTEAEITTPSAAENPSGSPSVIRITETSITNNYNINNELTSSTTTTTGGTEKPQQQSYEIEIDNVNPDTLQEKPVSFPFDTNSWGSGSCPADRTVNYHYGSLNLTFQPACDFAVGIKPIVLILAGFIAMYIISGAVRDA